MFVYYYYCYHLLVSSDKIIGTIVECRLKLQITVNRIFFEVFWLQSFFPFQLLHKIIAYNGHFSLAGR